MKKKIETDIEKEYAKEIHVLQNMQDDDAFPTPSMDEIRKAVQNVLDKKEQRQKKSFALFACVAALLLIGLLFAVMADKIAFIIIQAFAVIPLPFVAVRFLRRDKAL